METTANLCANFGHNFYREKINGHFSNVVKCKHCCKEIRMNADGDFEETTEARASIEQIMRKLNLLKNQYAFRRRRPAISL